MDGCSNCFDTERSEAGNCAVKLNDESSHLKGVLVVQGVTEYFCSTWVLPNNHCVFVNTELCRRLLTIDSHSPPPPSSSSLLLLWWWDDPELNFSNIQQQLRREPWSMRSSGKQEKETKQWLQVSVKLQKAWCSGFIRDDGCIVGPARLEQADKSASLSRWMKSKCAFVLLLRSFLTSAQRQTLTYEQTSPTKNIDEYKCAIATVKG